MMTKAIIAITSTTGSTSRFSLKVPSQAASLCDSIAPVKLKPPPSRQQETTELAKLQDAYMARELRKDRVTPSGKVTGGIYEASARRKKVEPFPRG
jgi:hypothetical protein